MELLAPAGNFECLKAAVVNGADAVYLGMEKYGARASAHNFGYDELKSALDFAHLRSVKVYLTLNTLIKNSEMSDALNTVKLAEDIGIDAFIVQDMGLISEIRRLFPKVILHASTQMGICNSYGAEFVKKLGLSRVVLARESLLTDIEKIQKESGLETEVFCQGALCVSYSGNCYYSSLVSGYSGNRGRCLQLCRKKYSIDNKSGYYLSAKDICLLEKVNILKRIGVNSLKIEGRMRTPEYVAESVAVYRNAIDGKRNPHDSDRLKKVFNRGDYCTAYFDNPTEKVIYPKAQNNIGFKCGKVSAVKNNKAFLKTELDLEVGDGVKYMRNGYEVGGGVIRGKNCTSYTGDVKPGDDVCITSRISLKNKVANLNTDLPAKAEISLNMSDGARMTLACGNQSVCVVGKPNVVQATNRAVTEADVRNAVGTLGNTEFDLTDIRINLQDNIFYPISCIKEMRKAAVSALYEKLKSSMPQNVFPTNSYKYELNFFKPDKESVFVQVRNADTLEKIKLSYDYIIYSPDDYSNPEIIKQELEKMNSKVFLNLPVIVRNGDAEKLLALKDFSFMGYVANNVSHFEIFNDKAVIGGLGLNHLNSYFEGTFIESIESDTKVDGIKYIYGKPTYMNFAHCPKKTIGGDCANCNGYIIGIKDDKGKKMEFRRIKEKYCYGILIPQIPINNIRAFKHESVLLDFSFSTDEEIDAVNKQLIDNIKYALPCTHANISGSLY